MDVAIDTEKTNPFEPGVDNPGMDEDIEIHQMTSSRLGSVDPTILHKTYEGISLGGDASETDKLLELEKNVEAAWKIIHEKFPNFNPVNSPFIPRLDEYGRVMVRLNRIDGKYYPLLDKYMVN